MFLFTYITSPSTYLTYIHPIPSVPSHLFLLTHLLIVAHSLTHSNFVHEVAYPRRSFFFVFRLCTRYIHNRIFIQFVQGLFSGVASTDLAFH
ncbi:hypothetical protein M413DRAFT_166328 [Hebeloma cylindrosporum]|uniref:Uncharacterized protein n=1 Tax=Hebeloma cylindrosporum TaxID=76867 RepID=A0A0C3BVP7_HEBCY|nr:hypothetical protein M413DRAFT_166328 [Hebeloma cylindrosporum h7]